jgi:transcription antitermination factor NusG
LSAIYCLFCVTGREREVANQAEKRGHTCLIPVAHRITISNGAKKTQLRKMFPGYVFVRSNALGGDELRQLTEMDHVIRLLRYSHGNYALMPEDARIISWLWQREGVLEVSQAYKEGTKVRIKSGPLKDLEAKIVQVNMKRNSVAILLGEGSMLGKIWCSVEMIEETLPEVRPLNHLAESDRQKSREAGVP